MSIKKILNLAFREVGIGVALLLLIAVFWILVPTFGTINNWSNILTQITINTIIAVGMTFVILIGGIDLSVGSVLALCSVVAANILVNNSLSVPMAIILSILASLAIGMACGLFNGLISEIWKIPPFITTLGMMNIARGAALQITQAKSIYNFPPIFNSFGSVQFFGLVPAIFVVALLIVFIGLFILKRTVFGRFVYCIGNNEEAVRLSGHNTSVYRVITFVISGLTVGIAGVVYMARLTIANGTLGTGFELNAIAAAIIGGTSFNGGKGSLLGTLLGASFIGILNNGLILFGFSDFIRQIITGFVIVIAVVVDSYRPNTSLTSAS
jgi:ribose transport system permease protein